VALPFALKDPLVLLKLDDSVGVVGAGGGVVMGHGIVSDPTPSFGPRRPLMLGEFLEILHHGL